MRQSRPASSRLPVSDVILQDGRSLRLRHIQPDDKKRMEELVYRRPWEEGVEPIESFSVQVAVR